MLNKDNLQEYHLLKTIVELSNEWTFVFDKAKNLVTTYIRDESLKNYIEKDFLYCFTQGERHRFLSFLDKIIEKGDEREEFMFCFGPYNYKSLVLSGSVFDEFIVVMGKESKDFLNEAGQDLLNRLPIPAICISHSGLILSTNKELRILFQELQFDLFTDKLPLSDNINHPMYHEISCLFHNMRSAGIKEVVTYKRKDIRLVLQGIDTNNTIYILIKDERITEKFEKLITYQQQLQAVSQIAAGVAHELRNPLSVIKGFLQLSRLSNNLSKYYDTIFSEIERMNKIIEDFLSISRKEIEKRYVKPDEMMESILMIFRSECLLHDIFFTYSIQPMNSTIFVNVQMMKQVLINILRNSVEAYHGQPTKRTFDLTTFVKDSCFRIELTDQGPGIPDDIMEKIDQPFFTTKEKGTGIGIPLCKQIIEDHNGEFIVESKPNIGTKVIIKLPLSDKKNPKG
ncbi:nitrogen regulation protein NR(II) [Evansella sp. AB-rgal1]|uniref:two-component system sensor histidine kinase NtrB n=1 Tax=Evansella sp. AB-rgal1 TaxID=3242696 RepID=UPI00359DE027